MNLTSRSQKARPAAATASTRRARKPEGQRDWALEKLPEGRRVGKLPHPDDPRRLAAIERGLDLLLRSYLPVRDEPPPCPSWVELLQDDLHRYTRDGTATVLFGPGVQRPRFATPERELVFALMGENPARAALQRGVRLLGEEIHRLIGSEDAMREALERVAALDPSRATMREVVMDKVWTGIGDWCA